GSILVVPANAFADAGSDCSASCGADFGCIAGCCLSACPDDPDCGGNCCAVACNGDQACLDMCMQQQVKKCEGDPCEYGVSCFTQAGSCDYSNTFCYEKKNYCYDCICRLMMSACRCRTK